MLSYLGGCQNYDPFLGTLSVKCRIIMGITEGPIILTTSHLRFRGYTLRGHGEFQRELDLAFGGWFRFRE